MPLPHGAYRGVCVRVFGCVGSFFCFKPFCEALAEQSGDPGFAFDSYRRFIQMYADVVLGIDSKHFEKMLQRAKQKRGVKQDLLHIPYQLRLVFIFAFKIYIKVRGKSTRCSLLSTSLPKDFVVLGDSFVLQDHELQVEDLELGSERYQKGRKGLKV